MAEPAVVEPHQREHKECDDDNKKSSGGLWGKLRSSLRWSKDKKTPQCPYCTETDSLLHNVEQEYKALKAVVAGCLTTNNYYHGNFQVGNNNHLDISEHPLITDELDAFLHRITSRLDDNIESRSKVEKELKELKIHLEEMNDVLMQLKNNFEQKDAIDGNNLSTLKAALVSLTDDRSDRRVITSGVDTVIRYTESGSTNVMMDCLPLDAQMAVRRIVSKFDMLRTEFANALGISRDRVQPCDLTEMKLTPESCLQLLIAWMKEAERPTPEMLLDRLETLDETRTQDTIRERKQQAVYTTNEASTSANSMVSTEGSITRSFDKLSVTAEGSNLKRFDSEQFDDTIAIKVHILDVADMILEIKNKVDEMHAKLNCNADDHDMSTSDEHHDVTTYTSTEAYV